MPERKTRSNHMSPTGDFSSQESWELLQNSSVGFFKSTPQGRYLAVNPALAKMLGYKTPRELVSSVLDIATQVYKNPKDRQAFVQLLQEQEQVLNYECCLLSRQGQEIWVSKNAEIVRDAEDNILYYQGVIQDISAPRTAQTQLHSSQSQLTQIVYSTPIATFVIDTTQRIIHWNLACEKLTGLKEEQMQGKKKQWQAFYSSQRPVLADLILEENTEARLQEYYPGKWRRSSLVKLAYEAEDFFADLGEQGKWIFFTAAPVMDQNGKLIGAMETLQDITERKNAEKALQESEQKYRTLIETASSGCWQVDHREVTVDVNQALCNILGYSREELIGKTPLDFVDAQNAPIFIQNSAGNSPQTNRSYEITLTRKDGRKVHAQFNSTTLLDGSGNITGSFAFVSDISRQKETEQALRESEEKYKYEKDYLDNIFENSADAIGIVDQHGRFSRWNKRASEIFGYDFPDMLGKHFSEFYAYREEMQELLKLLAKQGYVHDFQVYFINKDGSLRPCSVSISKIHDEEGLAMGSISIVRDLTEWKKAQERLEEMSLYDPLTSLYNRFFFEEEMQRLGDSRHTPLGIIICDIDGLKLINDTMGHFKGDELIQESAKILKGCFRKSDILARIGGDEFAVLLPESGKSEVQACCQRIKSRVEEYNQKEPELNLSISIGYAVSQGANVNMQELFKSADDSMYKEKLQQSFQSRNATLQVLLKTLETRDHITEGHTERLQSYALKMGQALGLAEKSLKNLQLLAQFHDLGKVGITDRILYKPGSLSASEFQEMQRHCEIGHRIALSVSYLSQIADLILKHHEWWNGQGYPLGLQGEDIPVECRILAVLDAFDTMTHERVYKRAMSSQQAVQELRRHAGHQFDPVLVEQFLHLLQVEETDNWQPIPDNW
ncbi:MAG: PAS domain S-box protein [Desulfohalobiaceae bacterium]